MKKGMRLVLALSLIALLFGALGTTSPTPAQANSACVVQCKLRFLQCYKQSRGDRRKCIRVLRNCRRLCIARSNLGFFRRRRN